MSRSAASKQLLQFWFAQIVLFFESVFVPLIRPFPFARTRPFLHHTFFPLSRCFVWYFFRSRCCCCFVSCIEYIYKRFSSRMMQIVWSRKHVLVLTDACMHSTFDGLLCAHCAAVFFLVVFPFRRTLNFYPYQHWKYWIFVTWCDTLASHRWNEFGAIRSYVLLFFLPRLLIYLPMHWRHECNNYWHKSEHVRLQLQSISSFGCCRYFFIAPVSLAMWWCD